jgi:farnesyl-diphosphate farnesyltransferase
MNQKNRDIRWSHDIVQDVSRTFAIPIDILERPLSDYTCVGYLLCRIPDTIEDDEHISGDKKAHLLSEYSDVLTSDRSANRFSDAAVSQKDDITTDSWRLVKGTDTVISAFNSFDQSVINGMRPKIIELVGGMKKYVKRDNGAVRIRSIDDLDRYCYYVAGTVGHLLTDIIAIDSCFEASNQLHQEAENYGLLLQLTNIIKDCYVDYQQEDNIYIPRNLTRDRGIAQENLFKKENKSHTIEMIKALIEHAKSFEQGAIDFLEEIRRKAECRFSAWSIPYLLCVATLREIDECTKSIAEGENIKISRNEVFNIVERSDDDILDTRQLISDGKTK